MNKSFRILFAILALVMFVAIGSLARETSSWLPVTGIVKSNTTAKRTIQYAVGNKLFFTDNENLLNLLERRLHITINPSRPGQSKTVINGVDPEIGKQVVIYYNPKDHSQAVVLRGWSAPVVILLVCSGIPLLLQLALGWTSNQNQFPDRDYP